VDYYIIRMVQKTRLPFGGRLELKLMFNICLARLSRLALKPDVEHFPREITYWYVYIAVARDCCELLTQRCNKPAAVAL